MKNTLLLALSMGASVFFAAGQANTKFTLVNDAFYGGPTINGLLLRANLGVLLRSPESRGYDHLHLNRAVGPTGLRTEFLVSDKIGLGTDAIYNLTGGSFSKNEVEFNELTGMNDTVIHLYEFTRNQIRVMGRINFHKKVKSKKLDVYTGLGFGTSSNIVKMTRDDVEVDPKDFLKSTGLKFSARVCWGFRWYPAKPVGINFELGLGGPLVSAGASSRFAFKLPEVPDLADPNKNTDNLKRKKEDLQQQEDMEEQMKSKAGEKQKEMEEKMKSAGEEQKKSASEKEKEELEKKKEELEKEKLELEIKKLEQEKKELEKEMKEQENEKP